MGFKYYHFCLIVRLPLAYPHHLALVIDAKGVPRRYQSSAGIGIPNFSDARFANNRASERRSRTCSDYAKRRRLKPKVNPASSPVSRSLLPSLPCSRMPPWNSL